MKVDAIVETRLGEVDEAARRNGDLVHVELDFDHTLGRREGRYRVGLVPEVRRWLGLTATHGSDASVLLRSARLSPRSRGRVLVALCLRVM